VRTQGALVRWMPLDDSRAGWSFPKTGCGFVGLLAPGLAFGQGKSRIEVPPLI